MTHFKFPDNFLWGAATSSFQIEGAANVEGKGPSIWDVATRQYPEKFHDAATPEIAADFYHRYPQDIQMMKALGLKSFRFSIAWPRIFPQGKGQVNSQGLDFYDHLIDTLLSHGIEPFIDLYHWDLPQSLADIGGFKNPLIIDYFTDYANVCFRKFGDRVKLWSTMNEPSVIAFAHYHSGVYPPFEKDLTGAFQAAQNLILSHYKIVRLYRSLNQCGKIGAVLAFVPVYGESLSEQDQLAARRRQDYIGNWWLDPMFKGHYPSSVLTHPSIKPFFQDHYTEELKSQYSPMDFVGINYYNPARVGYRPGEFLDAGHAENFYAQTDYGFTNYPQGLFDTVMHIKNSFSNPEIYITENGIAQESKKTIDPINDIDRIHYLREHLREIARALQSGIDIRGYYYWSLFDTFEATSGYRYNFGLVNVDFKTLERTPRKSWSYYQQSIAFNSID